MVDNISNAPPSVDASFRALGRFGPYIGDEGRFGPYIGDEGMLFRALGRLGPYIGVEGKYGLETFSGVLGEIYLRGVGRSGPYIGLSGVRLVGVRIRGAGCRSTKPTFFGEARRL
jgi:hypothetical protein